MMNNQYYFLSGNRSTGGWSNILRIFVGVSADLQETLAI
jgi:hypothetical protein